MACKRCGRFGGLTTDGKTMVMKLCCEQGRISGGGGGGGGGAAAAGAGSSTTGDNAAPVAYAPMKALANKATLTSSRTWFGSYVVCGARAEAVSAVERLRRIVWPPSDRTDGNFGVLQQSEVQKIPKRMRYYPEAG